MEVNEVPPEAATTENESGAGSTKEASGSQYIEMQGWLNKQGHFNRAWKKRWCVLKLGDSHCLEYYAINPNKNGNGSSTKPKGIIPLHGSSTYISPRRANEFVIQASINGTNKSFPLRAENSASQEYWVYLLSRHGATPIHTGWLLKKGIDNTAWKKRWCVLDSQGQLQYFTSPGKGYRGSIDIENATFELKEGEAKPGAFTIIPVEDGGRGGFELAAETTELREIWINHFKSLPQESSGQPIAEEDVPPSPIDQSNSELAEAEAEPEPPEPPAPSAEEGLSLDDFDVLRVVGKGAFGKVFLCSKRTGDDAGETYAMKVIEKKLVSKHRKQIAYTITERNIMLEIDHPYIVRLRYAFQNVDKLFFVTDYYNGGALFKHIMLSKKFNVTRARFYAAELVLALGHLHSKDIVYRDMKLENILMDSSGHIALTDFGLSKEHVDNAHKLKTMCGTAEYIAPEILRGERYGFAIDWWSFGILLYEMMNGRTPFRDRNRKVMYHKIQNREPTMPAHFPSSAKSIIDALLRKDSEKRLGANGQDAEEIMIHPYFEPIDWDALYARNVEPPYKPEVSDKSDTKYIQSSLAKKNDDLLHDLQSQPSQNHSANVHWDDFEYAEQEATAGGETPN